MGRIRRLAWRAAGASLLLLGLASSCGNPVEPRSRAYGWLDSYAAPGRVTLHWWVSTRSPYEFDYSELPRSQPIVRIDVLQSTTGPWRGFHVIGSTHAIGADSLTVAGLMDGRAYWFRLVAYDVLDHPLLTAYPVMTIPGPIVSPSVSIPIATDDTFSWSLDGDSIAFAESRSHVSILDLQTRTSRIVTPSLPLGAVFGAAGSPDGDAIAFTHTPTNMAGSVDYRVWVVNLLDGTTRSLTAGPVDFDGAWGAQDVYFCRGTRGPPNVPEIWRIDRATGVERAVTHEPRTRKYHPTVRAWDDLIVYAGQEVANSGRGSQPGYRSQLFRLAPAQGVSTAIVPDALWADQTPEWAPDGRHVSFISDRSGRQEVWVADAFSGAVSQVTRSPEWSEKLFARWSPDGRGLGVLERRGSNPRLNLYDIPWPATPAVASANGSGPR